MVFYKASFAAVAALFASQAMADQPVHCIKNQMLGQWQFQVVKEPLEIDLFNTKTICTHQLPNKVQILKEDTDLSFGDEDVQYLNILLTDDYVATLVEEDGSKTETSGTWSHIYDQGFFVNIDGYRFYANFKYEVLPEAEENAGQLTGGDVDSFNSVCDKTMPGFVQQLADDGTVVENSTQCFLGELIKPTEDSYEIIEVENGSAHAVEIKTVQTKISSSSVTDSAMSRLSQLRSNNSLRSHGRNENQSLIPNHEEIIEFINNQNTNFAVTDYSYLNDPFSGLLLAQTEEQKPFDDGSDDFKAALKEAQKYIGKDIDIEDLPDEWNWEDVNGYDFTPRVLDQGGCGSCYAFGTLTVLMSRLKIWFGVDKNLSIQMPLQCNYKTEGCAGGWGLMLGFFLEQFYTVDAECAPYQQSTKETACSAYAECDPVAKVANVKYLGDHYGGMSEQDLMKELRANGPFLMDLQVPISFGFYKHGILSDESFEQLQSDYTDHILAQKSEQPIVYNLAQLNNEGKTAVNTKTQEEEGIAWTPLNHSTVCIGYGYDEELDMKYWLVRNSYGVWWGDSGNFKIRRGHDDFGAEGEASAFDPILLQ